MLSVNPSLERQLIDLIVTRCSPNFRDQKISVATAREYVPRELVEWGRVQIHDAGDRVRGRALRTPESSIRDSSFVRVSHFLPLSLLLLVSSPPSKYECLVDRNADNDGPEDLVWQTFFGELQRVVQLDLPKSLELHRLQDETILLAHIKTCEATQNEDGFWEYSSIKPSPHFIDLSTIACVVGRVFDRGHWSFIDRSGPTAHVEMASPASSSACSDVTEFSTSDESSPEPASSSGNSRTGVRMDLDPSSVESSE